jgi:two-component system chemotaxis sensor kinase CheA
MGDGEVVPILNISDLLGLERWARAGRPSQEEARPVSGARKQILVVEDSITSRTLLKSILESSGYSAKTAIDGAEGFALLKSEPFDLVISDVDMPRMNGFELTRKIRADRNLADLPVILVTALESQRDRESGIDAGASAYIVKSKFDNMNLLQTIQRLI